MSILESNIPSKEDRDYFRGYQAGYVEGSKAGLRAAADAINMTATPPVILNSQVKAPASGKTLGWEYISVGEASARLFKQRDSLLNAFDHIKELKAQVKVLQDALKLAGNSNVESTQEERFGTGTSRTEQKKPSQTHRQFDHADPWDEQ